VINRRPLVALVAAAVAALAAGCAGGGERAARPDPTIPVESSDDSVPRTSPLADHVVALGPATYDVREHQRVRPAPASLRIDPLGVDVPVTAVGVEDDGELAVPGPADVGWYRFGPAPGEEGTTVLAAHVAYDGVDGVFRHLDDLEPGDTVVVDLAGGATMTYQVERVETYPKDGPPDALWWRTGPPRLALVTCGGTFDTERRSYDSNVVAWATSR
jgi:LPXTG-site transpeptidase (sortase) family protein